MIRSDGVDETSNSYRSTTQHAGHVVKSRLLIKTTGQVDAVEPGEVLGAHRREQEVVTTNVTNRRQTIGCKWLQHEQSHNH